MVSSPASFVSVVASVVGAAGGAALCHGAWFRLNYWDPEHFFAALASSCLFSGVAVGAALYSKRRWTLFPALASLAVLVVGAVSLPLPWLSWVPTLGGQIALWTVFR